MCSAHPPPHPHPVSSALLQHPGIQYEEAGDWEAVEASFLWFCTCRARPCPVQPAHNQCRTAPWAGLMRSGETLAGGGQSGPSVLGGADGWSLDSNRRMRTRWRRSRPRPCCLASPGAPPSPLLLASRCLLSQYWT